jgi:hypothetical protein
MGIPVGVLPLQTGLRANPRIRDLIRKMAAENPIRGEERIANELRMKLGIRVSPRTVGKLTI